MKQVINGDGQLTISLGFKEWFAVIFGIVAITAYVLRIETTVAKHEAQYAKAESTEVRQDKAITNYGWRMARVERKAGIVHPQYDDEDYVGPEPYRQRRSNGNNGF